MPHGGKREPKPGRPLTVLQQSGGASVPDLLEAERDGNWEAETAVGRQGKTIFLRHHTPAQFSRGLFKRPAFEAAHHKQLTSLRQIFLTSCSVRPWVVMSSDGQCAIYQRPSFFITAKSSNFACRITSKSS
jgi:hypothetical protein